MTLVCAVRCFENMRFGRESEDQYATRKFENDTLPTSHNRKTNTRHGSHHTFEDDAPPGPAAARRLTGTRKRNARPAPLARETTESGPKLIILRASLTRCNSSVSVGAPSLALVPRDLLSASASGKSRPLTHRRCRRWCSCPGRPRTGCRRASPCPCGRSSQGPGSRHWWCPCSR